MKFYLVFVCINLINGYFDNNECCDDDEHCLLLDGGDYPIYCPSSLISTSTKTVSHKKMTSLNPVGFNSSKLQVASSCDYDHCVGGYDEDCPALSTCVGPTDDIDDPGDNCNSFDNCVGANGVDCEGITIIDLIHIQQPEPCAVPDSNCVSMQVSVGSIYHDLCCREHPGGSFCDSSNYQLSQATGSGDIQCACVLEFRKAIRNYMEGKWWRQEFSSLPRSSDLTPVSNTRSTWFPKSILPTSGSDNWYEATYPTLPQEVQATSELCAPRGTELDCPKENQCKVSCTIGPCKTCASGASADFNCKSKHYNRWDDRDYDVAGDANFCCSGEFQMVMWRKIWKTGYGICA